LFYEYSSNLFSGRLLFNYSLYCQEAGRKRIIPVRANTIWREIMKSGGDGVGGGGVGGLGCVGSVEHS